MRGPRVVSSGGPRVLVVNGERSTTEAVVAALREEGFETCQATSGHAADAAIAEFLPDLIVLDVMLPDLDGLEIARRLRNARRTTPIIFLTAKDSTQAKLAGLAVGDDYVTQPFSVAELVARVYAVLRRTRGNEGALLRFEDIVLDEETHQVWRAGEPVNLTPTEFNLLRVFMLNPRRVLSKRQIMDVLWQCDLGGRPNLVETYVCYLRRKLDPLGPPLIQTIRLVGYALRKPEP
jgi:two-component system, OmpR family, response regulator